MAKKADTVHLVTKMNCMNLVEEWAGSFLAAAGTAQATEEVEGLVFVLIRGLGAQPQFAFQLASSARHDECVHLFFHNHRFSTFRH